MVRTRDNVFVVTQLSVLRFEWDPSKAATNRRKHGVSFETATRVFADPNALFEQDRVDNGEMRENSHEETVRLISSRNADRKERKRYEEANGLLPN